MIEQLHDTNLALQAKWNGFAIRMERRILLCTLYQVRQTQCSYLLCRSLGYDFGCSELPCHAMPDQTHTRAASTADSPTELPRPNVCLAASIGVRRVGAGVRDSGVAFGIVRTRLVGKYCRETLVRWGTRLRLMTHSKRSGRDYRLIVGQNLGWRGCVLETVLLALPLRVRVLVCAVSTVAKGASTCWRTAMVAVIHDALMLVAIKVQPPQQFSD